MMKSMAKSTSMFREARAAWGFLFREYHLKRRYISWVLVFLFYAVVNGASVVLIGVASGDPNQVLNLMAGVLMWTYLSGIFFEIANSISYERWEGTIEFTFMAPVSRFTHMMGLSVFAALYSLARVVIIGIALTLFVDVNLSGANLGGMFVVFAVASLSFVGIGLVAAVLPLMNPETGAQATNIVLGSLLLVSGVYFPVSVLPGWLQPLSVLSPATYALDASRSLLGVSSGGVGAPLSAVAAELGALTAFGLFGVPVGLWIFVQAERWAKRSGKLKRSG